MKTLEEAQALMANNSLPAGELRRYQKCRTCGNIMVREFIPFGLGYGRSYDACSCNLTGNDRKGHETLLDVEGPINAEEVNRGEGVRSPA